MREWAPVLRFVHDNITLLVFLAVATMMATAWIIFEALRSHRRRDEVYSLRRKIADLERERTVSAATSGDPVVLPHRWLRAGNAAATSDGGCLLYVNRVNPNARAAELTVRIDGRAVLQNRSLQMGESLKASGKNGTYVLELYGVDGVQAHLAVALRHHHRQ